MARVLTAEEFRAFQAHVKDVADTIASDAYDHAHERIEGYLRDGDLDDWVLDYELDPSIAEPGREELLLALRFTPGKYSEYKAARRSNPRARPPAEPTDHDWNLYVNFVIYAVVGLMREADGIMRGHGGAIERVAAKLMKLRPVRLKQPLYRGLLLAPDAIIGDHWVAYRGDPWLSYTENEQVACWFANPESYVSDGVALRNPAVTGWVSAGKMDRKKVLWHHSWQSIPLPNGIELSLAQAAAMHPDINEGQVEWNMRTQAEVLCKAPTRKGMKFHVEPISKRECPDVSELNETFTYPPYLRYRVQLEAALRQGLISRAQYLAMLFGSPA